MIPEAERPSPRLFDFELKLAQNKKEVDLALKLRHEVFLQELCSEVHPAQEDSLDADEYDAFCDHLIVIDKLIGKVVGTYRLLLGSRVSKDIGFYSEKVFDIRAIKALAADYEICELGRSCVHKDYRSRHVINLLWNGIGEYVRDNNIRFLFGAPRLSTNDPLEVSRIFRFMQEKLYAPEKYRVSPKSGHTIKGLRSDIVVPSSREALHALPPLIKGYIRAGIVVCGPPAVNPLGAVVIFAMLDIEKLPPSYKQHYL